MSLIGCNDGAMSSDRLGGGEVNRDNNALASGQVLFKKCCFQAGNTMIKLASSESITQEKGVRKKGERNSFIRFGGDVLVHVRGR